jgi:hypothetical protein
LSETPTVCQEELKANVATNAGKHRLFVDASQKKQSIQQVTLGLIRTAE